MECVVHRIRRTASLLRLNRIGGTVATWHQTDDKPDKADRNVVDEEVVVTGLVLGFHVMLSFWQPRRLARLNDISGIEGYLLQVSSLVVYLSLLDTQVVGFL